MFDQPCQRGHLPLNPGNTDDRKQASYDLRRSIKAAKRTYKNKVEEHFNNNNPRSMWQGINNITGFKGNKPATVKHRRLPTGRAQHLLCSFSMLDNTAHTESAHTTAAEEVSPTHAFCRRCNPILLNGV